MKSLRRGGRLVTCGATTGPSVSIDIRHLFSRQISLVGSFMGSKGELLKAAELFFDGTFAPVIDRTYPLEAAAEEMTAAGAELVEIDRRRLVFRIEVSDELDKVGEGVHERFIVDAAKVNEKMAEKAARKPTG